MIFYLLPAFYSARISSFKWVLFKLSTLGPDPLGKFESEYLLHTDLLWVFG